MNTECDPTRTSSYFVSIPPRDDGSGPKSLNNNFDVNALKPPLQAIRAESGAWEHEKINTLPENLPLLDVSFRRGKHPLTHNTIDPRERHSHKRPSAGTGNLRHEGTLHVTTERTFHRMQQLDLRMKPRNSQDQTLNCFNG